MQPLQYISSSGGEEDTWPEWIKKGGLSPQRFGTWELAEETESGRDVGGRKRWRQWYELTGWFWLEAEWDGKKQSKILVVRTNKE